MPSFVSKFYMKGRKGVYVTYQSFKDTLSRCRAARLDFPYVVLGNLV
jgi:hypothetical protein